LTDGIWALFIAHQLLIWAAVEAGSLATQQKTEDRRLQMRSLIDGRPGTEGGVCVPSSNLPPECVGWVELNGCLSPETDQVILEAISTVAKDYCIRSVEPEHSVNPVLTVL